MRDCLSFCQYFLFLERKVRYRMITMLNHDSKRQTILFEQAWDYLKTLPESDGGLTSADREAASSYGKNTF